MSKEDLTFENVLAVFANYLAKDDCVEIIKTSRGYAVIEWDDCLGSWIEIQHCPSPVALQENLLGHVASFLEYGYTSTHRKLTEIECEQIRSQLPISHS